MSNKQRAAQRQSSGRVGPRRRVRIANLLLVSGIVAASILLVAGCGTPQPTATSVFVTMTASSTPEAPTATKPVDTATPTLTHTPRPTQTPTPPDVPSPIPPTATSTPTPTETPLPTNTPVPPTNTPVPPTSTKAPPTNTPQPPPPQFPWRGQVAGTFSNCALTRLMGLTLDRNGGVAGDIWVHFWADGWNGAWTRSNWAVNEGYPGLDDSSNWDGILDTHAKAGTWHACVAPADGSWDCISTTVTTQTVAEPCAPESGGAQIIRIVFQQN